MTISIEEEVNVDFPFDYEKTAKDVIHYTTAHEKFPFEAEVNLLLTDDEGICLLNREFREIDSPTDVLSFPMIRYEKAGDFSHLEADADNFNPDTGEVVLGDIVVNIERVKQQAESYGHSNEREFAFLIVHSMLHLFGYDHMEEDEAAAMEGVQREILEDLRILR
ncbi:MAG: rRNA maturation RNase YbeY [Eubacterium sp.]|nr:rRNA maturation RNase YbeY [Eubacterium sp.]